MKKITIFLFIALAAISCTHQKSSLDKSTLANTTLADTTLAKTTLVKSDLEKTSLEKSNIKGKVSKIQETNYDGEETYYDVKDKFADYLITESKSSNSKLYEYNEYGNILQKRDLDEDGVYPSGYLYVYDKDNIRTEYSYYDKEGVWWRGVYKIEKGRQVESKTYDHNGKLYDTHQYLYEGNHLISNKIFVGNNYFFRSYTYEYDNEFHVKKIMRISENGISFMYETFKDKNGDIVKEITYENINDTYIIEWIDEYIRDSYGNVIQEDHTDFNHIDVDHYRYEYEYDNKNNWIKRYTYKNGKINQITVREITYFQ